MAAQSASPFDAIRGMNDTDWEGCPPVPAWVVDAAEVFAAMLPNGSEPSSISPDEESGIDVVWDSRKLWATLGTDELQFNASSPGGGETIEHTWTSPGNAARCAQEAADLLTPLLDGEN